VKAHLHQSTGFSGGQSNIRAAHREDAPDCRAAAIFIPNAKANAHQTILAFETTYRRLVAG
jgi:hypothetical protein